MTETVYAVIDNHSGRRKTTYNFMYKTKNFKEFIRYVNKKGLN